MVLDQLTIDQSLFLLIDYQDKFFSLFKPKHVEETRKNLLLLVKMMNELKIPLIGTEHYVKGLGHTAADVMALWGNSPMTDKVTFSCCGDATFLNNLAKIDDHRKSVIVAGLETQICVLQTVLDLRKRGYHVFVAKDACLSSTKVRWQNGLDLMAQAGAVVANTETIIFYLLQRVDRPEFKTLVKLLKESSPKN